MGKRLAAVVAALMMIAAACSEPAPDEVDTASDDDVAESVTAVDDADPLSEGADSTEVEAVDETDSDASADTSADEPDDAEVASTPDEPDDADAEEIDPNLVLAEVAGQPWFLGTLPTQATEADPSLDPITIGMINQEDTPLGSFPEVRAAAEAAVAFINNELGGVDGRPIELTTCITSFNPEQSATCAQEMVQEGVVALVGGVDLSANGAFPIIEQNGLAVVGGIPAGLVEQRSPNAFSFSGGGAGAAAAFMKHAVDNGASRVLLAYGEFESFEVAARDYAAVVGESLGLDVELLSFSLFATDYLPILTKAQEVDADAVIVLAADAACIPIMQNSNDLGLDAQIYLTGACASNALIQAAGDDIVGVLFNSEGPLDEGDPEGDVYSRAVDRYATQEAGGAGTVGFRAMMNLYGVLTEVGADAISAESVLDAIRSADDQASFWGHPYTCDGRQVPGLPALCAPQQVLFEIPEPGGVPTGATDWIDTAELFQVIEE